MKDTRITGDPRPVINGRCSVTGKKYFQRKEDAMLRAMGILHECGLSMRSYRCPYCDGFHLTRVDKPTRDKFNFKKREQVVRRIKIEAFYWEEKFKSAT